MYVRYNDRRYTIDDFRPSLPGCQGIGRLAEQLAITNMGQCAKGRWKSEQRAESDFACATGKISLCYCSTERESSSRVKITCFALDPHFLLSILPHPGLQRTKD